MSEVKKEISATYAQLLPGKDAYEIEAPPVSCGLNSPDMRAGSMRP